MTKKQKMVKEAPEQKKNEFLRKEYSFLDSCKMFLNVIIYPILVSFIFLFVVTILVSFSGKTMETASETWIYIFFSLILTQATFLVLYILYNKKYKIDYKSATKINKNINWWLLFIIAIMSVVSIFSLSPLVNLLNDGLSAIGYNPDSSLPFVINNGWKFAYATITMALIPAIVEELLMRGIVFQGCLKKWKPTTAILIGALMFMLMHTSLQQTFYQFIIGVILCYLMYVGGNIIYPMVFHFINNFMVILSAYLSEISTKPATAIAYSSAWDYISPFVWAICGLTILAGLCYLAYYLTRKQRQKKPSDAVREEVVEMIRNVEFQPADVQQIVFQKEDIKKSEKVYFWVAIACGCVLWLINTLPDFFV